jgi:histone-lysine N-methyltransferase SETMAR
MQVCQDLLNHYEAEGDSFLGRVITGDEMWCHHYEPESKDTPWSGAMRIPHQRKSSAGKVMCIVFWDRKGVIQLEFLEPGQTINSDHYITTLTKLKARISRVRLEKKTTFLLQHDNAWPHTSLKTMGHAAEFCWTVLLHPPYSPNLAPSDFHLFGPMKDGLRAQYFPDNDTVIAAVREWVASTGADFYERSMQALVLRQRKCIANGGDYVE